MKTDTELKMDVIAELGWEPSVNAARIGVEVNGGVVTLAGHLDSYTEKWHAERAAQRVTGVKALAVEIDVSLLGVHLRNDEDIARSAENILQWISVLPPNAVKVLVEGGWVTLTGEVEWQYQRKSASDALRHLMGATGISNQITIKSAASSIAVKSHIEAALKSRSTHSSICPADAVAVAVKGQEVTLSGTVPSWAARELAKDSAWASPGVQAVVDKMVIAR